MTHSESVIYYPKSKGCSVDTFCSFFEFNPICLWQTAFMVYVSPPTVDLTGIAPQDRYKAMVQAQLDWRAEYMTAKARCENCVLMREFCVCSKLVALAVENPDFEVVVFMNQKEQFRSSNTAKVIRMVLNATILIDGVDADNAKLTDLMNERKDRCFVLFPSESASEWNISQVSQLVLPEGEKILIIVVDGTWRQARRLNLKIPSEIPRIKIMPTTLSKFLCRRQTQADRVCTIEALALLLQDMGRTAESLQLDRGLATLLEGFNTQCFGSTCRPARALKDLPEGKDLPPRHPDTLLRD